MEISGIEEPNYDNQKYTHTIVPEDKYDQSNNDRIKAKYNKTYFFPLTRWVSKNRNKKITHKRYIEFRKLCSKVRTSWYEEDMDSDIRFSIWEKTVDPISNTILHLWDVRGELTDWIADEVCKVLLTTQNSVNLPQCSHKAFHREQEYRGGPNSIEMVVANIDSHIIGSNKELFDSNEIEEVRESGQGQVEYNHNLDQYFNPDSD